jgi:hypothetical protein
MSDVFSGDLGGLWALLIGCIPAVLGFALTSFLRWIWDNPKIWYLAFPTEVNEKINKDSKTFDTKKPILVCRRVGTGDVEFVTKTILDNNGQLTNDFTLRLSGIVGMPSAGDKNKETVKKSNTSEQFPYGNFLTVSLGGRAPITTVVKVPKRLVNQKGHNNLVFRSLSIRFRTPSWIAARMEIRQAMSNSSGSMDGTKTLLVKKNPLLLSIKYFASRIRK